MGGRPRLVALEIRTSPALAVRLGPDHVRGLRARRSSRARRSAHPRSQRLRHRQRPPPPPPGGEGNDDDDGGGGFAPRPSAPRPRRRVCRRGGMEAARRVGFAPRAVRAAPARSPFRAPPLPGGTGGLGGGRGWRRRRSGRPGDVLPVPHGRVAAEIAHVREADPPPVAVLLPDGTLRWMPLPVVLVVVVDLRLLPVRPIGINGAVRRRSRRHREPPHHPARVARRGEEFGPERVDGEGATSSVRRVGGTTPGRLRRGGGG